MSEKEVESSIKSCIVSLQGDVTISQLNRDYRELVGENIPWNKFGHSSLESFLITLSDIYIVTKGGTKVVKYDGAKSAHIASLVNKSKPKKKRPTKISLRHGLRDSKYKIPSKSYQFNQSKLKTNLSSQFNCGSASKPTYANTYIKKGETVLSEKCFDHNVQQSLSQTSLQSLKYTKQSRDSKIYNESTHSGLMIQKSSGPKLLNDPNKTSYPAKTSFVQISSANNKYPNISSQHSLSHSAAKKSDEMRKENYQEISKSSIYRPSSNLSVPSKPPVNTKPNNNIRSDQSKEEFGSFNNPLDRQNLNTLTNIHAKSSSYEATTPHWDVAKLNRFLRQNSVQKNQISEKCISNEDKIDETIETCAPRTRHFTFDKTRFNEISSHFRTNPEEQKGLDSCENIQTSCSKSSYGQESFRQSSDNTDLNVGNDILTKLRENHAKNITNGQVQRSFSQLETISKRPGNFGNLIGKVANRRSNILEESLNHVLNLEEKLDQSTSNKSVVCNVNSKHFPEGLNLNGSKCSLRSKDTYEHDVTGATARKEMLNPSRSVEQIQKKDVLIKNLNLDTLKGKVAERLKNVLVSSPEDDEVDQLPLTKRDIRYDPKGSFRVTFSNEKSPSYKPPEDNLCKQFEKLIITLDNKNCQKYYKECLSKDVYPREEVTEPTIFGHLLIGDDFFLRLAENRLGALVKKQNGLFVSCGLCVSRQSINSCKNRLQGLVLSKKVIVMLGAIDILKGATFLQIKIEMLHLIKYLFTKVEELVVLAVPPFTVVREQFDVLVLFNQWLKDLVHLSPHIKFVDLWPLFTSSSNKVFEHMFVRESYYNNNYQSNIIYWSHIGTDAVVKLLRDNLLCFTDEK